MNKLLRKILVVLFATLILVIAFYFVVVYFEPANVEAKKICDDTVRVGMSYEEVEHEVGYLFLDGPYGIDENGDGEVYLGNNIKYLEGNCRIGFKGGYVESSLMLYTWL
jgi:ABC-type dipeptide/oligopeptide/nickel transport system permease component